MNDESQYGIVVPEEVLKILIYDNMDSATKSIESLCIIYKDCKSVLDINIDKCHNYYGSKNLAGLYTDGKQTRNSG